jgi:hypothetical protein
MTEWLKIMLEEIERRRRVEREALHEDEQRQLERSAGKPAAELADARSALGRQP